MISEKFVFRAAAIAAVTLLATVAHGTQLPTDVRANHWAASSVTRALQTGLMRNQPDGLFHGDSKVTRVEVAIALGKLGRMLVEGAWKPAGKSQAVPDSVTGVWDKTNWKTEPVRRYALAVILTHFGDYAANGVPRPATGAVVGKTEALPEVAVKLPAQNPAYESLTYLAKNRMVKPGSVLLKGDSEPVTGFDLSRALADLGAGFNDRLTDLGKDAEGNTKDISSPKPPPR